MSHAPDDEYELEIEKIRDLLNTVKTASGLAIEIHRIFLDTCGEEFFKKTYQDCFIIAKKIIEGEKVK